MEIHGEKEKAVRIRTDQENKKIKYCPAHQGIR
jgi:hypothetical protein